VAEKAPTPPQEPMTLEAMMMKCAALQEENAAQKKELEARK
jgi:hypothetical protein